MALRGRWATAAIVGTAMVAGAVLPACGGGGNGSSAGAYGAAPTTRAPATTSTSAAAADAAASSSASAAAGGYDYSPTPTAAPATTIRAGTTRAGSPATTAKPGAATPSTAPATTAAPGPTAPPTTTTTAPPAPPSSGTAAIHISGFKFDPAVLQVAVGTKVTVDNQDSATHTWTDNAGHWDSGPLAQGARYTFEFKEAGTYTYHCSIHASMTGTVSVG